jgi:hypothetical protein
LISVVARDDQQFFVLLSMQEVIGEGVGVNVVQISFEIRQTRSFLRSASNQKLFLNSHGA